MTRDKLFSDQLYMEINDDSQMLDYILNSSIIVTVVSYKNLTVFLPKIYFVRNR